MRRACTGKGPLSVDQPRRRWAQDADPLDGDEQPTVEGVVRELRRVPLARLLATALIILWAILFARYSWEPPVSLDESRCISRQAGEPHQHPDRHRCRTGPVRLAPGDRRTPRQGRAGRRASCSSPIRRIHCAATAKRSPLDRAILARALTNLDKMGAKAIGIDILIDQPQPEDQQLLATLKAMKTPVWLAYANRRNGRRRRSSSGSRSSWTNWFRQLAGSQVRPTSIRLEPDGDNVLRRWPSLPPGLPPFMPLALAGARPDFDYQGSVEFRACRRTASEASFHSLQIDRVRRSGVRADCCANQVRGKIVLIGGDLPDVDQFEIPASRLDDSDHERARGPCDDDRAAARRPPAGPGRAGRPLGAGHPGRPVRRIYRHARRPAVGRRAGHPRPADLLRPARPSIFEWNGHRHLRPARLRLARRLGAGLCRDRRRGPRGRVRSSAAMPSQRSANICRATSPRRSCAIRRSCR